MSAADRPERRPPIPPPFAAVGRPDDPRVPQRGAWADLADVPPDPEPFDDLPLVRSERVYDSPWCSLRRDVLELPGGAEQEYHVYEISNAACVVPVRADGRVVLIGQHRHPHGRTHWEIPAGRIADGERPRTCAERELLEETGYAAGRWVELPGFYPTNGISAHYAHAFVALDCSHVAAPATDLTEQLVVRVFTPDEIDRLVTAGRIQDGFAVIGLSHYLRARAAGRLS